MSNKQTDLYLEEMARIEEDLRDAQESLDNATQDLQDAIDWKYEMKEKVEDLQVRLAKHKNKEF